MTRRQELLDRASALALEFLGVVADIRATDLAPSTPQTALQNIVHAVAPQVVEELDNPITSLRMRLGMTRSLFAIHMGMGIETVKDIERGRSTRLGSKWEVALERAGQSYPRVAAQYKEWREGLTRSSVDSAKVTQIGRAS